MSFLNLFLITPCSYTHPIITFISVQEKHYLICLSSKFKNIFDKKIFYPLINLYTQSPQKHTYHEFKYVSSFQFNNQIKYLGLESLYQDIIFICDTSGSMRRYSKRTSMLKFIDTMVSGINQQQISKNIGLISFNQQSKWIIPMTSSELFPYPLGDNFLKSNGMTNFESWVKLVRKIEKPSILVLISDMDTNIKNKNNYIPILKKHFFYQIILPPGNNYISKSLNHISNGYGRYFLSSQNGIIPSYITQDMLTELTNKNPPQLICYQTHVRFHPIIEFDTSLPSSSFLIEDEPELLQLKKLPIKIIYNGSKVEQWDCQHSRLIIKNQSCPWEIFRTSLIKKMSHLNYYRTKLLEKEYPQAKELEDLAYYISSLDIYEHERCLVILGDLYNSEVLYRARSNHMYSSRLSQNYVLTEILMELNIIICKAITSIEHQHYDKTVTLLLDIQTKGEELTQQKIKKMKKESFYNKNQYYQLFKKIKFILTKEIKTILKFSDSDELVFNDDFKGLKINEHIYIGNLEGNQLETLIYLYCCLHNSDLYNFELDGDVAEYIPSTEIGPQSGIINESTINSI